MFNTLQDYINEAKGETIKLSELISLLEEVLPKSPKVHGAMLSALKSMLKEEIANSSNEVLEDSNDNDIDFSAIFICCLYFFLSGIRRRTHTYKH